MDEAQWLACDEWRPMLDFLFGRFTQRKAMLYVCAGLRSLWDLLYDDGSRDAVEVAERAADGAATDEEVKGASYHAESPTFGFDFDVESVRTWNRGSDTVRHLMEMGVYTEEDIRAGGRLGNEQTRSRLENAAHIAYHLLHQISEGELGNHLQEHLNSQEEWPKGWLVREIFGNPFQSVTVSPTVLAWNDGIIIRLAQAAYEERVLPAGTLDNARLAILADALEEAGCSDEQILTHLRSGGEHYRGCFVLDLLLGKS